MPNFRPSADIDYLGNIAGSPAATVAANAVSGLTAFDQTATFRDTVIPNGTLNAFSPNSGIATQDGNVVVNIDYTYTDGARVADYYVIFYKQGGGTVSPSNPCIVVNPSSGVASTARINVVPGSPYTFAFSSARVTKDGVRASSPQNQTARTVVAGNYTGNISNTGAATVVTNAGNGATAFSGTAKYRTAGAPTNLVVPTGISVISNSNATKTIRVSWDTYVQGANQADVIGLFYRKDNYVPTFIDSCILMNVNVNTPAYYDFLGVTPTDPFSFGIAAGRRTESGIEWGLINTTYGSGPYYLYADSALPISPTFNNAVVSPLSEYTPNGEQAFRVTDNTTSFLQAQWSSAITAPGAPTRFQAEAFIKQDVSATKGGMIRLYSSALSYRDLVFKYTDGSYINNSGAASSPEYFIEPMTVNGINWYRVGISAVMSPDVTIASLEFYPAIVSPPNGAYDANFTGSGTIGGVEVRRVSNTNAGFDWTAITADSAANFTGSIAGSPAAAVVVNAGNGATAFTGTSKYRTNGAPTNLVTPTGVTVTTNSNATKTIRVSWDSYVQGVNQADVIGLFYRKDNNIPTYTDSCIVMNVNVNTSAYYDFFGVNPTDPYSFGIAAGRRTENGVEWGLINTTYGTSTWYLYGPDLAVQVVSPNGVTVSPSADYTPNGEATNIITDNSATIFGGANLSSATGLSIPTTERWFAETFVKDTTTTNILSIFRVYASETSYGQITFNRGSGTLVGSYGPASPPTEGFIETITVNGQDWYRIGVTGTISPGYTTVLSTIYPAIYSPGAPAWSPEFTGAITMGPVSIRKLTNASTGFDWTAITADAAANFTGNLAGSPATTIVSNANNAFTGTTKYRTAGAPTNLPVPTNIVSTTNSNASKNITIYWDTYTQGTNQADFLVIYWRKDNNTPTYFDNSVVVAVNTGQPSFWTLEGVPPDQAYSFGIAAGRRTESGTELTSINTTFGYTGSPQYIYNESVTVPNFNSWPASNTSPVASTNIAPNGLLAYTLADDSAVLYENASYTTNVASPGLNSVWQTEWWVKRDPTANNIASLRTFLTGSSASPDQLLEFKIHPGTGTAFAGASGTNTSLAYYNVETISDYTSPSDVTWYRVIYAGSVSAYNEPVGNPISNILLQIYPSVGKYSPGNNVNNAFSPDATGSITIVPGGLRKINRTISPDKDWTNITANTVNYTANINNVAASTVTTAVTNFNTANDKNNTTPTAPTTNNTSADITSVFNQNNTIDLTVNWNYSPATANFNTSSESIDGFIVYLRSFPTGQTYTLSGASPETQYVVPIAQRAFTIPSLPSDKWYHAGIRAYRVVNKTVDSTGSKLSSITETTAYPNGYIAASQFPVGVTKTFSSSTAPYDNKFTTDVYTDAYWTQSNASPSLSSPSILTPDGVTRSYVLTENAVAAAAHNIQRASVSFTAGKWAVIKALVKSKSGDRGVQLRFATGAFTVATTFTFRFDTLLSSSTAGTYSSVKKLANDWYLVTGIAQVNTTATSTVLFYLYDHATSAISYNGNGTSGIYFSNFAVYEVDSLPDLSGTPYDTVGDTWYNPTTLDYKTWNGSQWVQSATYGATFGSDTSNISGLSGDGINRVLARFSGGFNAVEYDSINSSNKYIIFPVTKDSGNSPVCSIISGNGASGPTSGFYGTKAIKIYDSSGVGNRTVYFSSSSTNYNMPIDPNSKWILSSKMWCGSPANVPLPITMGVRTATSPTTGYTATQNITVKQTWQDFAGTLNLSNDSSDAGLLFIKVNSSPSTSPAVYFDGLMLEKRVGPGTTPSKWVKSTKIGISGTSGNSAIAPGDLGIGSVLHGLTMNQGDGTLRPVLNGLLLGYARDGDVVSFSPAYSIVPTVIWLPGAKVTATSIPANASATYEATGLTTTGFTAKLKLTGLSGTTTTITETFGSGGTSNSVISPSGGGANITADYVINKGNSALEAWDDKYTYKYNVSITNTGPDPEGVYEPGEITVAGYARIATGWVQVFTNTHSGGFSAASTTRTINTTFTLDGVIQSPTAGQYEFAIDKIYNPNDVGGGITAFTSVTYATASPPTQVPATDSTSYSVPYIVIANTTGV